MTDQSPLFSIYYGASTLPPIHEAFAGQCIHIDPSSPNALRLNGGELDLHGRTEASEAFSRIKEVLTMLCDPWSRSHLQFIERYFSFIEEQCERNRTILEGILLPFGMVYTYNDFRFSAWLPLPLAWIEVAAGSGIVPIRVRTDFLFWSGHAFIAVELRSHTSRSQNRRSELALLREAGVNLIEIDVDTLRTSENPFTTSAFPKAFSEFWAGEPFPSGPLKVIDTHFALDLDGCR